ncbi:dolichyl-diphosphooligosaccharide--protein glycosyltransferase subunit DAD1 [Cuculus canorus]|uniref:dolichyl-diphosphooligosaccharide--protein glycosyltransferase subunit DAD1 n=1 Tax=Cuculus canorus TaxID=55661 RepID=UPI0023AAB0B7|nr:dolichyl-diphosphooligosaccharide--protein glycosyltransferase subunit DAD1 [Cuculus canorus]
MRAESPFQSLTQLCCISLEKPGLVALHPAFPSSSPPPLPVARKHLAATSGQLSGTMSGSAAAGSVGSVVRRFLAEYGSGTPSRLKVLDAYLLYVLLTGALQFGYCLGVGTFPFNSFLSGFISAVGSFILGVCLRIQINPQNKGEFQGISPERAFADFLFANTILHLVVINFVG